MVILPFMEIYMGCTDADQNVDGFMLICCGILSILKNITFRVYARNLTSNFNSAVNDYMMIKDTKERAIMRKHASVGRILCFFMLGFSYSSCLIYSLNPYFADNNKINNVTNEVILEYTVPSRCAVEYFYIPRNMLQHKILCFIEALSITLTSTTNHGNIIFAIQFRLLLVLYNMT